MNFTDGKRTWVVRRGLSGKRMFRAEPVETKKFRAREARIAR